MIPSQHFTTAAQKSFAGRGRAKRQNSVMVVTSHLRISGRVQGVGFRDALYREAVGRGLTGWVRNRRDGTVEAIVQGEAAAVDAVQSWVRRGPPAARVDRVEMNPAQGEFDRPYSSFEWMASA
jgi:acylphosphatase